MRTFDLTQTFDDKMPVYPGDPNPELKQSAFIEEHGYNEFHLSCGMHIGTHMDAPLHMIENGALISDIPSSRFFGRGQLIDARGAKAITASLLDGVDLTDGDIVLVHTDWHKRFRDVGYYGDYPLVEPSFAQRLVEAKVSILALDTPSPDHPPFPVHKILLGSSVLIIENITNLDKLVGLERFEVIALPAKLSCEGAPVRIVARSEL